MRKVLIFTICIILLSACAPTTQEPTPTPTMTATKYIPPTATKIPTLTPMPTKTITPTPEKNYVYELGWCLFLVGKPNGNPRDVSGCVVEERSATYIPADKTLYFTLNDYKDKMWFCTTYDIGGNYLLTTYDSNGIGSVDCLVY